MPAFRATGPGARIPPPFSGRDFASRGWAFRTSGSTATRCRSRRSEPRRASGRACSGFPRTSSARCRERAGRRRPATRRQGPPGPAAPRPRHCPGPRCPGLAPSSARVEFLLQPIGFSFASPHARRTVRPTAPDRAFLPRQPGGAADGGEGTDREGLAPVPRGGGRNRLELAPGAFGCCCSFWSGWRGWGSSRCSCSWPPFRPTSPGIPTPSSAWPASASDRTTASGSASWRGGSLARRERPRRGGRPSRPPGPGPRRPAGRRDLLSGRRHESFATARERLREEAPPRPRVDPGRGEVLSPLAGSPSGAAPRSGGRRVSGEAAGPP